MAADGSVDVAVVINDLSPSNNIIDPEAAALEAKYGSLLASLDRDSKIDRTELLKLLGTAEKPFLQRMRVMKVALGAALALLVLFALTVFGMTWAVVVLSKDARTDGGLMVSKSNGEPVSTGVAGVQIPASELWRVTNPGLLDDLRTFTVYEPNDAVSIYQISKVRMVPNVSVEVTTTAGNVTFYIDAEGVSESDAGAPGGRRLLGCDPVWYNPINGCFGDSFGGSFASGFLNPMNIVYGAAGAAIVTGGAAVAGGGAAAEASFSGSVGSSFASSASVSSTEMAGVWGYIPQGK